MTLKQKNNLIAEMISLLEKTIIADEEKPKPQVCNVQSKPLEMLTVEECSQVISGLSEHTVRQWVSQGLIPYIRTGRGKYGICGDILILGYTDVVRAKELKKYDLMQTLIDYEYACSLNEQNIPLNAHIKIDTGMHRLGIPYKNIEEIKRIFEMKNIKVRGIYTHLCCSDSLEPDDAKFTEEQIVNFKNVINVLKSNGISIPKLHIQSSYGLLNYPEIYCNYVRLGIALYGAKSLPSETALNLDLRPVLSLKSKIVLIRNINKGGTAGYGRKFTAARDSRIAVLPIGYGDGFPRNLSCGKGSVIIKGHKISIIGQICMDCLTVDITNFDDIVTGDTAELICAELPAENVAENSESISNELLCRMGERLPYITV